MKHTRLPERKKIGNGGRRCLSFVLAVLMCLSVAVPMSLEVSAAPATHATPSITAEYRNELLQAGFPESYIPMLAALHEDHPNWTFTPLMISDLNSTYTWDYVISQMMANRARNLVTSSSWAPSPFNSLGHGNYNPYRETSLGAGYDSGWYAANEAAIKYFMDPRNFLNDVECFMFLDWHYEGNSVTEAQVEAVLGNCAFGNGTVIPDLDGHTTYAQYLVQVGSELGVDPMFLATRLRLENGSGTSPMVNGTTGDELGIPKYNGYYNFYNISAGGTGTTEIYTNGMEEAMTGTPSMASQWGGSGAWNTRWKAIYGGAYFLKTKYVDKYKNTLYLQKFNTDPRATGHFSGYMQNIAAPLIEGRSFRKSVVEGDMLDGAFNFQIPVYSDMPASHCADPGNGGVYYSYSVYPVTNYHLILPKEYNALELSSGPVVVKEGMATTSYVLENGYSDDIPLRGWSVSMSGTRSFYYTVNGGSDQYTIPAEKRLDVFGDTRYKDYSQYCDSTNIGYNGSLDPAMLGVGDHVIRIYAVTNGGGSYQTAQISVTVEGEPSSANVYHEFDFTKYSTDALSDYRIDERHNAKVSPNVTDKGYVTFRATGDDPYLVLGGTASNDLLTQHPANYLDYVLIKYQTTTSGQGALFVNRTDGPYWGQDGTSVTFNYESCDIDGDGTADIWRHVLVDASKVWGNTVGTHLYNFRLDFLCDEATAGDTANISYIKFYGNAADARMCIEEDSDTTTLDPSENPITVTTPVLQIGSTAYTATVVYPLTKTTPESNSKSYGSGLQVCCDELYQMSQGVKKMLHASTSAMTANAYLKNTLNNTIALDYQSASHVGFYGWANPGMIGAGLTVTAAGYQIGNGEPVWSGVLTDNANGAISPDMPNACRFDIKVDVSNIPAGRYNVYLLVKLSDGSVYCINDTWTESSSAYIRINHGAKGTDYGTHMDASGTQYTVDDSKNLLALGGRDTGLDVHTTASLVANGTAGTGIYAASSLTQVTLQSDGSYTLGSAETTVITHAKAPVAPPEASCEHDYKATTEQPTCDTAGSTYSECSKCHHKTSVQAIPATGHTMTYTSGTPATCTQNGTLSYYTCSVCHGNYADEAGHTKLNSLVDVAKGHTPGDPVRENEVPPTTTEDGRYDAVIKCTVCSAEISRESMIIPAKGFSDTETVATTGTPITNWRYAGQILTVNGIGINAPTGYRDGTAKTIHPAITDASHMTITELTLSGWAMTNGGQKKLVWSIDGNTWYECRTVTYGNATDDQLNVAKGNPSVLTQTNVNNGTFNLTLDLAPAYGQTVSIRLGMMPLGVKLSDTYSGVCHFATLENLKVDHTHSYSDWATTAEPTCTAMGTSTRTCYCGFSQSQSIPAKGHTEVTVNGTPATCSQTGLTEGKQCSVCKAWTQPQQTIPTTAHTEVTVSGTPATCTQNGTKAGKKCSACGVVTQVGEEIPATGHEFGDWSTKIPATCTQNGVESRVCGTCGDVETHDLPMAEHEFGDQGECIHCGARTADFDGDGKITQADAIHAKDLIESATDYTVTLDFDGDGQLTQADAEHLLLHRWFPELYPLMNTSS